MAGGLNEVSGDIDSLKLTINVVGTLMVGNCHQIVVSVDVFSKCHKIKYFQVLICVLL